MIGMRVSVYNKYGVVLEENHAQVLVRFDNGDEFFVFKQEVA